MPAGDLITAPGQVEFAGLLFDVRPTSAGGASDVWIHRGARRSGWHPTRARKVLDTEAGGAAGKSLWEPMWPSIEGVCCESASDLADVIAALDPTDGVDDLFWWSFELDAVFSAKAVAERPEPVENDDSSKQPRRFVDVMWLIQRPGLITEVGS